MPIRPTLDRLARGKLDTEELRVLVAIRQIERADCVVEPVVKGSGRIAQTSAERAGT